MALARRLAGEAPETSPPCSPALWTYQPSAAAKEIQNRLYIAATTEEDSNAQKLAMAAPNTPKDGQSTIYSRRYLQPEQAR